MKNDKKEDQFFSFLLNQFQDPKEKLLLELVEEYRNKDQLRELLKKAISEWESNN